jgi:GT2 family glycosyltransferase
VLSHRHVGADTGRERSREVAAALARRVKTAGGPAEIELAGRVSYRIRRVVRADAPLVSVVVPTTGRLELLRACVDGVLNRTAYPRLELLVIVSGISERRREDAMYLEEIQKRQRVSVLYTDSGTFNFSSTNNIAVARATGELLCFLNDDTEVLHDDWLAAMTGHVLRDRVGAVGAKLLYPNGRIQHAGVVLGAGGVAAHSYKSMPQDIVGYHDRAVVDQEVSCVTAACMLVRREAFTQVGGFDEALALAYNDVDLCLRLRQAGWRIVWTPFARLYHRESVSSGPHNAHARQSQWASEWDLIRSRWAAELSADPSYNPNLSLDPWELWEPGFPPRASYSWREE